MGQNCPEPEQRRGFKAWHIGVMGGTKSGISKSWQCAGEKERVPPTQRDTEVKDVPDKKKSRYV